jgi:DNA-binding XRE family transcriptional regulator
MPVRTDLNSPARAHPGGVPIHPKPPTRSASLSGERLPLHKSQPVQNRVQVFLVHIPRLSICGQARLAAEAGVSRSTISRLVGGRINPSYRLARSVTSVLERMLGKPLDMRDVFSTDGTYLSPSGCALCGCGGCLPEAAWGEDGTLKPAWQDARPGDWSLTRPAEYPLQEPTRSDSPKGERTEAGGTEAGGKEGK